MHWERLPRMALTAAFLAAEPRRRLKGCGCGFLTSGSTVLFPPLSASAVPWQRPSGFASVP